MVFFWVINGKFFNLEPEIIENSPDYKAENF